MTVLPIRVGHGGVMDPLPMDGPRGEGEEATGSHSPVVLYMQNVCMNMM